MPFRVLFLCTGNSVRSQMAEALLNHRGAGRFHAESAGSMPARSVHPRAIEALRRGGIEWQGHVPRHVGGLEHVPWDLVVTVCDHARDVCPVFPSRSLTAHWGMPAPVEVVGNREEQQRAFQEAFATLSHRIDQLVALPVETLERSALEARVREIGKGTGVGVQESGFGKKP
jgi:arsenate reductase (thioredoxin)